MPSFGSHLAGPGAGPTRHIRDEQAKITQNVLHQCYDSYGCGHIGCRKTNHRSYRITVIREVPIAENRHAFTCPAKDLPILVSGPEQVTLMAGHEP
jgi:hypothetical protein